jgi:glycopeptide antibiotics resistance protein
MPIPPVLDRGPSGTWIDPVLLGGWHGWFGTYNGAVLMTALALPVVVLFVVMRPRTWATVGLVYGTVPWLWMTLIPGAGAGVVPGRLSLIPFKDLLEMGSFQAVGNLFVLGALGFFGPIRFVALRSVRRVLILATCCSASIEIAQYALRLDRVSSVDDVLLNTAGAGLAAMLSRRWWLGEATLQVGVRDRAVEESQRS